MGFLSSLFKRTKRDKLKAFRANDDELLYANSDIIAGYEFNATLQLRTPLCVLDHHGEMFEGPSSKAPVFGDPSQGMWLPITKTYRELGIDMDEAPEGTSSSDIGSVYPKEYIPFLKAFRQIVESEAEDSDKAISIRHLQYESADFAEFYTRHAEGNANFPEVFLRNQHVASLLADLNLDGIGAVTVGRLFDAGFTTADKVRSASESELRGISGIGPKLAKRLANHAT